MLRAARTTAFGRLGLLGLVLGLPGLLGMSACKSVDYEDLPEAQVDAYCEFLTRCGLFHDVDYCVEVYAPIFDADPDLDAAIDNGTVIYDDAAAKECLGAIRDASCDADFGDFAAEACDQVLQGTIDDGGACWISAQCIGGACIVDACMETCCVGTCTTAPPDAAIGQPCGGGQGCAGGYCDFNASVCAAYKPAGAACDLDQECGDLYCLGGTCQASVAEGAPCVDFECGALGLDCDVDSGTCQRLRGEGEACNPAADICSLGLVCPEASAICSRPGGVGSPCDDILSFDCAAGTWCDYDFVTGDGTCQPRKAAGGACERDDECDTGYCGEAMVCEAEPVCVE